MYPKRPCSICGCFPCHCGQKSPVNPPCNCHLESTISVGTVVTREPEECAEVCNSGTANHAILNFFIPRGATGITGATGATGPMGPTGTSVQTDILAAVNPNSQTLNALDDIVFQTNVSQRGINIGHIEGHSIFTIVEPGIYQLYFHANVSAPNANYPFTVRATALQNDVPIENGIANTTVTGANDILTLHLNTIFYTNYNIPGQLVIRNEQNNIIWKNAFLVLRKLD